MRRLCAPAAADQHVGVGVAARAEADVLVDVGIGHAQALLVALAGQAVCRRLYHQVARQLFQRQTDLNHLDAGQRAQQREIARGIAVLGAVAHRRFGQVARAGQPCAEALGDVPQRRHAQAGADIDVTFAAERDVKLSLRGDRLQLVGDGPQRGVHLADVHRAPADAQRVAHAAAVADVLLFAVGHHHAVDIFRAQRPRADRRGDGGILAAGDTYDYSGKTLLARQAAHSPDQAVSRPDRVKFVCHSVLPHSMSI